MKLDAQAGSERGPLAGARRSSLPVRESSLETLEDVLPLAVRSWEKVFMVSVNELKH
jgi:hypothetical protein